MSNEQVFDKLYRSIGDWKADWHAEYVLSQCKSPIETLLASHMPLLSGGSRDEVYFHLEPGLAKEQCSDVIVERTNKRVSPDDNWMVFQQVKIAQYSVDFFLFNAMGSVDYENNFTVHKWVAFAVECDGHNFHDKTKEQAARDKKRDRQIQALNVPILRFTGSEIYRDAIGVINEIHRYATGKICRRAYNAIDDDEESAA
jgi:very-short-patch-repair endonuclease